MDETSPGIREKADELILAKTPEERFKIGCEMNHAAKKHLIDAIRQESPSISDIDLRIQFFLRFYSDDFSPEEKEKFIAHLQKCTFDKPFSYN